MLVDFASAGFLPRLPEGQSRGRSHLFTQKGPLHTITVSLKGLPGNGPALAGRLGGGGDFALRARGGGDRLQCSLRPDPAAAVGWGNL